MGRFWIRFWILILMAGSSMGSFAQSDAHQGIIRGTVKDAYTGKLLSGAKVTITNTTPLFEVACDDEGSFLIENVPTGRVSMQIAHQGYDMLAMVDVVLNEGKELVLDLELNPLTFRAAKVTISVPALSPMSGRSISAEETKRFAAVYFDPARVATAMPGVVQSDDQANHLVVRGNSPNGVLWRLEGLDILNPNHLTNAGTLGDRATAAGGGTSILSTQLLGRSTFTTSAFTSQYGNALGGVFDIRFRPGNNKKHEFTAQAGLIGVEMAAEGPFSKQSKSSFLINYRYSTVGLLSLMGVPLGDEDIRYQDLAFRLNFPTRKAGTFGIFGMGGLSSNKFTGQTEDSLVTSQKDRFNINFISNMGATGLTHSITAGSKTLIKSAIGISGLQTSRENIFLQNPNNELPSEQDGLDQSRLSITSAVTHEIRGGLHLKAGAFANRIGYAINSRLRTPGTTDPLEVVALGEGSSWLLQPYTELNWRPVRAFELKAGLHAMYFTLNESKVLEPRALATIRLDHRQQIHVGFGLHSQIQLPGTYFSLVSDSMGNPLGQANVDLDFSRARHYVLNYDRYFGTHFRGRIEGYYQQLFQIPIVNNMQSTVSAINLMEGYVSRPLINAGTGRNYGLELNLERLLYRNYYFLLSGTLYRSLYTAGDGIERASRYDGRFATAFSAGYEWDRESKKGKQQIFGLNLRTIYRGGMREMPVDLDASRAALRTVYDETNGFTQQLPNYFRLDIRFTFKRNRPGYTSTLGVDIQNAINTQNASYYYYDFELDEVLTRYQLGIIPLLSYRMEF